MQQGTIKGGKCPNGHGSFEKGSFCPDCGTKLEKAKLTNGWTLDVGHDAICPSCQTYLDHGHQARCPRCGHKLNWICCR